MLSYKFPDRKTEAEAIKHMSPDKVGKLRDEVTSRLRGILESCDDYFENLIESYCGICQEFGYGYFDLPPGWGWMSEGTLLCDKCQDKWEKRFGYRVKVNREGEIVYEQQLSEDSAHWRQADFEFV